MTQQRQDPDPRAWSETKHQVGDSNVRPFGLDIHNPAYGKVMGYLRFFSNIFDYAPPQRTKNPLTD